MDSDSSPSLARRYHRLAPPRSPGPGPAPEGLDDPCLHAPLSDPGGPLHPAFSVQTMQPSVLLTTRAALRGLSTYCPILPLNQVGFPEESPVISRARFGTLSVRLCTPSSAQRQHAHVGGWWRCTRCTYNVHLFNYILIQSCGIVLRLTAGMRRKIALACGVIPWLRRWNTGRHRVEGRVDGRLLTQGHSRGLGTRASILPTRADCERRVSAGA